jgi:RNA ligase
MKYANYDKLEKYVADGLIEVNKHPDLPLYIYNYSRKVQYEQLWDEVTLECRGLVLDETGEIIAKSLDKFFNLEEVKDDFDWSSEHIWIQEKMDGSMGILFYYGDDWHMATRGSFMSEQAKRGMEILRRKYDLNKFLKEVVYICEIIYPENRIVVDYGGDERIVFMSATSNDTELAWATARMIFHLSGIDASDLVFTNIVTGADRTMLDALKTHDSKNREGYVVRFWPTNKRVKIKFDDYVRLHRLLTNFSNVDIWEHLKEGKDINEFLDRVPDEFDKWVKQTVSDINYHKYRIEEYAGKVHDRFRYGKYNDRDPEPTKKEFALHLAGCDIHPKVKAICFSIWDGKDYSKTVWDLVRPEYSKPFWNKEDK